MVVLAATAPAAAQQSWQAEWIGTTTGSQANSWYVFRKRFTLSARPFSAPARIACDTKYWLWINGRMVVFEGQLKRGPTPVDTYYDSLDLAPYLQEGENVVAVLLWYWGKGGFSHRSSGQAALLFEAEPDGMPVVSDSSWKARRHPAYGATEPPHPNQLLAEPNVQFDARLDLPDWPSPGYDDRDWPSAESWGPPPTVPWNQLFPRPIPLWDDHGLGDYESIRTVPGPGATRLLRAHLPYDAQVTPYLEVVAPAGLEIAMWTDTYASTGATGVRSVYVTREGRQAYESFGWMSGHEVVYSIPAGVRVVALKYRETGYDAEFAGRFASDDDVLDTLWEKARRTLYVTMRDTHLDCPDRERAQYGGDLAVEMAEALYALDASRGPLLARKGLLEMARWQRDDGVIASPVPHGLRVHPREIPMQGLAVVGWHGLWTYYLYTGDAETVMEAYPAVREYLRLWRLGEDGLVVHREGEWDWADWYGNADIAVLENAWYYLALRAAAHMATLAGHGEDQAEYQSRMRSIETAFNATFWRGDHYRSPGHGGHVDDRGNALAVVAGLAEPRYYPAILDVLDRNRHASPYMEKYVLEALFLMDEADQAIQRMKERWAPQVESGLSTLWEFWEWSPETVGTYNHGWAGGALPLLSRYAAGIAPTTPGYGTFVVQPRMGPLSRIHAVTPTPAGPIDLELRREPLRFTMRLSAPPGTSAVAAIPVHRFDVRRIEVNGDVVWRAGLAITGASAVRVLRRDGQWLRLTVPPGTWEIEASGGSGDSLFDGEIFSMSENPIRSGRLVLYFQQPPARVAVYALDGRRVVDLLDRMNEPSRVEWDLTNSRGAPVAPGIYFLVADIAGERIRRKLIIPGRP